MDFKAIFQQIGQIYQNLSLKQRIIAASSVVFVVGFLVFLSIYKSSQAQSYDGYSVLFENISPSDSALIVQQLEKNGVKYKIYNEGTILVPTADVYKERISVASMGILKDNKVGFEIFDKQEFGATDAEQKVKFQRALEGELARTIESLAPIDKALVRIAIPKETLFTERTTPPSASIVLNLKDGQSLNLKQITGIKNLVSSAVANLTPQNVKIVNQDGIPLGEEDGDYDSDMIAQQIRYKREAENALEQKILNVLSPIVGGMHKVVAKVTIDFDFSRKDSESETFDPNSVARSEQNIEEKRQGSKAPEVQGVPGAVSNIGPVEGLEDKKLEELYTKSSATTNYEISKKVMRIKDQFATIKRLSAAVVVDGRYENKKDESGNLTKEIEYIPLNKEQLDQINALIKQSVGFDANRGDEVTLSNFEFQRPSNETPASKVNSFFDAYVTPFLPILKYLFVALLLFIFYKKIIVPFMEKMVENIKEEEPEELPDMIDLDDSEDALEKFKAAKKKVEEQLGIGENFNEDELRYDVLLEKTKLIVQERSEEISVLLQDMIKNDVDFSNRKDF
ncbi:flagellar basal-body MS-ring/collar protein FliF [Campylobacter sp. CCUG 57310]|uniref:flagellar basal-body MS-ring/collar protein FliF n=1 Tax=Campylobacter sp. CCUG 57310 TaxID=2517362 RepID=UPI001565588F|nr:flagellar basal-body MS-ring/collar protein FliF [Campylobacter sp. CCUG 57310]QKF92886.1 flagellar inner membrane MS-ring protein FliF [Campylobacter sp. CCUG 57310]